MRDYGKVHTAFWSSDDMRSMSEDARMLALYLLTSPHNTIAGVFHLPDGYVCEDMQWSIERVSKGFEELLSNGFANRCATTKWVFVLKHLEWNPPENPNQRKAAAKIALTIPQKCTWKQAFMRVAEHSLGLEQPAKPNPSGTLSKPLLNQKQEQKQKQEEGDAAPSFVLPDWIPAEPWDGYVEMRKRIRKPMTDRARKLVLNELQRLMAKGHDLSAVLDNSTRNNWVDVYEPKGAPAGVKQERFV